MAARRDHGPLGGLNRRKLIRELALREPGVTNTQIAKRYNVTGAAIGQFAQRHADEIAAVAADADDEFAGMLIARKAFRLGVLEELVEKALTPQPKVTPQGRVVYRYNDETGSDEEVMEVNLGEARQALKQAAEELGQLANRITLSGQIDTTTTYKIANVTDEDLT